MATINSKETIEKMIAANGALYDDEPPCVRIVQYVNNWGGIAYGCVFEGERQPFRYDYETEYIHDPIVIFQKRV